MMGGSWDPSHASPPHHCSLDSNHRSPAQAVAKGFSKQQHLPPWQVEQDHGSHLGHPWLCHMGKGLRECLACSVLVSMTFAFEGM